MEENFDQQFSKRNLIMELPVLNGMIDRRILINYRIDPDVVKRFLPEDINPLVINGFASGGICLLRLKDIGAKCTPSFLRINSENAAYRFLVTYRKTGRVTNGVYIPRRDTDSKLNVLVAGKVFSWPHYPATFLVVEDGDRYCVDMKSIDGESELHVNTQLADYFPGRSMFSSIDHASDCFRCCSLGVSPSTKPGRLKLIELKTKTWNVRPLNVHSLRSSLFDNESLFPKGSLEFDNAMLMQNIEHEWCSERFSA